MLDKVVGDDLGSFYGLGVNYFIESSGSKRTFVKNSHNYSALRFLICTLELFRFCCTRNAHANASLTVIYCFC